jgi:hypothetical protein
LDQFDLSRLAPPVDQRYTGPRVPFYLLILIAVISTVRSLIHILRHDGGAQSIAGIKVTGEDGRNIVAIFAQWGSSQLILALFYWLAVLRYRFLVPLALTVVAVEQILRIGSGRLKPLDVAKEPPGAIGSRVLLPISIGGLIWSLRSRARRA